MNGACIHWNANNSSDINHRADTMHEALLLVAQEDCIINLSIPFSGNQKRLLPEHDSDY